MTEDDWAAMDAVNAAERAKKEHARSCRLSLLGRFCLECEQLDRERTRATARFKESR
jgi:hypothetical protein